MNLVVLSLVLIIVMLLAVYAMTRQSAIEAEIKNLVSRGNIEQIYDEYRANHRTLNLYVLGGILLTGGFALTFFGGGGIDPRHWSFEQSAYAVVGLVATVSITLGQRALYRSIKQNIAALLVTLLVLAFVIFSEVATTSEREASLVRDRSLDSPTLQAVLQQIASPDSDNLPRNTSAYYAKQVEYAKQQLQHCKTQACNQEQQALIQSYTVAKQQAELNYQQAIESRRQDKLLFTEKAQQLEYNEANHTAVIRWIKEHSGVAFSAAMMFASLIFVVAFESGFHFTGTKEGIYLEAIARLGYTVKRKSQHPTPLLPQKPKPPTQPHQSHVHEPTQTNDTQITVPDDTRLADMQVTYETTKVAKAGDSVVCPSCAQPFTKKTYNQCFCCSRCKDEYWNTVKPERRIRT